MLALTMRHYHGLLAATQHWGDAVARPKPSGVSMGPPAKRAELCPGEAYYRTPAGAGHQENEVKHRLSGPPHACPMLSYYYAKPLLIFGVQPIQFERLLGNASQRTLHKDFVLNLSIFDKLEVSK